jgi:hypothetical protein
LEIGYVIIKELEVAVILKTLKKLSSLDSEVEV